MATSGTSVTDAYLAGLFDGEGCVSMSLAKAGYMTVNVKVTMCDRAPIATLFERFGGYFSDGKQRTPHGRYIYTWSVFNGGSVEALSLFAEMCLVKNVVAAAALPCAEAMRDNKTRGALTHEQKVARLAAASLIAKVNKPVGARLVLDATYVESYLRQKTMGGGIGIKLSDGRVFPSVTSAAKALGVSISAVSLAKRKGSRTAGVFVEAA